MKGKVDKVSFSVCVCDQRAVSLQVPSLELSMHWKRGGQYERKEIGRS